ncbi:MAG: glycosyltransferase family A protein [Bacteroidales bacterium]|nr:glycosyltransferase family A protein [Bacteroidales bacterium]
MNVNNPLFSIIVPSKNGGEYLKACIESIITQNYSDYELIISDDNSTDSTEDYLKALKDHPNILLLQPKHSFSMTEHWEWALSHAKGQWMIFVGQDDGLQPYFFIHAEKLIEIAKQYQIRTITSTRAYFFWPGCKEISGNVSVNYLARNSEKIRNATFQALKTLFGMKSYFELPQMYTSSIFSKSIIEETRLLQDGKVLTCHPQDANLAAIACSLDKHYLESSIPLGWVGTSPKSAGLAITHSNRIDGDAGRTLKELENNYKESIYKSKYKYNKLAGDFSFGDPSVYFWQAMLETPSLRKESVNKFLISGIFKTLFFSTIFIKLLSEKASNEKKSEFDSILVINNTSKITIWLSLLPTLFMLKINRLLRILYYKVLLKIRRLFTKDILILKDWSEFPELNLKIASELVLKEITKHEFIKKKQ